MSRWTAPATFAIVCLLGLLDVGTIAAQPAPTPERTEFTILGRRPFQNRPWCGTFGLRENQITPFFILLDQDKVMAQGRYATDQATSEELARQRVEAARQAFQGWYKRYQTGRDELDDVLDPQFRLLQAQLAANGKTGMRAALEENWRHAVAVEITTQDMRRSGKSRVAEHVTASLNRLEIQRNRADHTGKEIGALEDLVSADDTLDYARRIAHFSHEAEHTSPAELDRERLRVARLAYRTWQRLFQGGRLSADELFEPAQQLLRAELAVRGEQSRVAVLEQVLCDALEIEAICRKQNAFGRIRDADYSNARRNRLEIQFALARLRPAMPSGAVFDTDSDEDDHGEPLDRIRNLARARYDAAQMSLEQVLMAWQDDARKVAEYNSQLFGTERDGTGMRWPETIPESTVRRARAELVGRGNDGRAEVAEASWQLAWQADEMNQLSLQSGRIYREMAAEARALRLEMEMELARLREQKPAKPR